MAHPDLGEGTRLAASTGAWIVFEDEAGATLRPPKARTWAGRGRTPQVAVSGRGGRVSMAALVCYRPGHRSRLFYRILVHRRRTGERRSFSEDHYAALIAAAHAQLTAPIILVWDNLERAPQRRDARVLRGALRLADRGSAAGLRSRAQRHRGRGRTSNATWATYSPARWMSSPQPPRGCSSASSTDPSSSTASALRPA
jgi:hypothetical protein